jgi:hypothetical protein
MRTLVWIGAVAVVVIASGAIAGQKPNPATAGRLAVLRGQASRFAGLHPSALIDRVWSFDANKDHRIARDELPERMEGLISRGDKNHDGFLTSDEVVALIDARPAVSRPPVVVGGPETLADVIADLKLPPRTHARAMAIVKGPRNVYVPGSVNVNAEMRELLNDEDYENFVAAAARVRSTPHVMEGDVSGIIIN